MRSNIGFGGVLKDARQTLWSLKGTTSDRVLESTLTACSLYCKIYLEEQLYLHRSETRKLRMRLRKHLYFELANIIKCKP